MRDILNTKNTENINSSMFVGEDVLKQAPDNEWIVLEDTQRYGITEAPNQVIKQNPQKLLISRMSRVKGSLVYLRDKNHSLIPYVRLSDDNLDYKYIPVKDGNKFIIEPYYVWVIRNEKSIQEENPKKLALAKYKMGYDTVSRIQSGKYTYGFDASKSGQIDLETAGNEILDDVRYSMLGDTRDLYTVSKINTPVFIYNKHKNYLSKSHKNLKEGTKVKGISNVNQKFRYHLPEMVNYDGTLFFPAKKLKKVSEGVYEVMISARPLNIFDGKIIPLKTIMAVGTKLKGVLTSPVIEKVFSFICIADDKKRSIYVNKKNLHEMLANESGNTSYILSDSSPIKSSSFEGGDIEDFHGGDVNFCGETAKEFASSLDGNELVVSFDSTCNHDLENNSNIQFNFDSNTDIKNYANNTEMYFNMDSNVKVLGDFYDNSKMDLSFDADTEEESSNAIGDWFKNIFNKKSKEVTLNEAKKIADPKKVEYTPKEVQAMYEKSGSKKPIRDWIKSDSAKNFMSNIYQVGYQLLLNKSQGGIAPDNTNKDSYQGDSNATSNNKDEKLIVGMHPITFGIVTASTLLGIGLITLLIIKSKK